MEKILACGAGLQTTALVILIAERKLEVDAVVFADTGGEKPETYFYLDNYIKPLLSSVQVPSPTSTTSPTSSTCSLCS